MNGHPMVATGYNPALVALSIAIAIFASYTALDLGSRVEGAAVGRRWLWVAGAAVTMGVGIWSMHFVGMLAFETGLPAAYDVGRTILSLVIAIVATGAAFAWVSRPAAGLAAILVGGPLMGIGIAAMHYTGMAAMTVDAAYRPGIVILSIVIAMTAATAALWLAFLRHGVWQKLVAAVVMGIGVAAMHYTGMTAATFTASGAGGLATDVTSRGASQLNLAFSVAGATFVILFVAMVTSSIDQQRVQGELRRSEERFRAGDPRRPRRPLDQRCRGQDGRRATGMGGHHRAIVRRVPGLRLGERRASRRCGADHRCVE